MMMDQVLAVAQKAGELLMQNFQKPGLQVKTKADGSLVTEADFAASDLIKKGLASLGYPVVTEEDIPHQVPDSDFFIVDPLDGTKYFAQGDESFATLISFISQKRPVLGVAYFPALNLFYRAEKSKGSYLNNQKIFNAPSDLPLVAYSSGFHNKPLGQKILKELNIQEIKEGGSVLKLCRVAEGLGDFYPRFGPTSEWDTGACQILLEEAGCSIVDTENFQPLLYKKPQYLNKGFVCFRNDLRAKVQQLFTELRR